MLRAVVIDPDVGCLSASAGLSPVPTNQHIVNNIKETIKLAAWTKHAFGRPTDDKRSLVQSTVLASLPSLTSSTSPTTKPTNTAMASALRLSLDTCKRHVKAATPKQAALEDLEDNTAVHLQVLKSKGHTKITPELQDETHAFIKACPHIAHSPLKNDAVLVRDPDDPSMKMKKPELLL